MKNMDNFNVFKGYTYTLLTLFMFSTYEIVCRKISADGISPIELNFFRFLLGSIFIFIILLFSKNISLKVSLKELKLAIFIGIMYVCIGTTLTQFGLSYRDASMGLILIISSMHPLTITLISSFINKQSLTSNEIVGICLGFIGLILSFANKLSGLGNSFLPYLFILMGNIIFSFYIVICDKSKKDLDPYKTNFIAFVVGCVGIYLYSTFTHTGIRFSYMINPKILYVGLIITGGSVFTLFKGISLIGQSKNSSILLLKPFLASVFVLIVLGEKISLNIIIGTSILILGISCINCKNQLNIGSTLSKCKGILHYLLPYN